MCCILCIMYPNVLLSRVSKYISLCTLVPMIVGIDMKKRQPNVSHFKTHLSFT